MNERVVTAETFGAFLVALRGGMTRREYCDTGALNWNTLKSHLANTPEHRRAYDALCEAMPFDWQLRNYSLGDRFYAAVIDLYREGLSNAEIAERLGVTDKPVATRVRKHKRAGS